MSNYSINFKAFYVENKKRLFLIFMSIFLLSAIQPNNTNTDIQKRKDKNSILIMIGVQ